MTFEPLDFQRLNEPDVRGEIIDPLLRQLGYRSTTENNIIREQDLSLRYPNAYLGRKKPGSDPILRGRADYICEVAGPIRWVIEAKPPSAEIGVGDIEQAHSYANHPEVRAALFCLCNGRELRAYQTSLGPDAAPLLSVPYEEFDSRFSEIDALLSPNGIKRVFPAYVVDAGKPLGPGLRSIVRIVGGHITFGENTWNNPALRDLNLAVTEGSVERDESEHLIATIKTLSSHGTIQRLNEKLGIDAINASSADTVISTNPAHPTRFSSGSRIVFPQGEKGFDILNWREFVFPRTLICHTETEATGALIGGIFQGSFYVKISVPEAPAPFETTGTFRIHLA